MPSPSARRGSHFPSHRKQPATEVTMDQGIQRFLQAMDGGADVTAALWEVWPESEQAVGPLLDALEEESNGGDRNAIVKNLHEGLEVVGPSAALPLCQRLLRATLPAQVNLVLA